jgi:hypothetical protein
LSSVPITWLGWPGERTTLGRKYRGLCINPDHMKKFAFSVLFALALCNLSHGQYGEVTCVITNPTSHVIHGYFWGYQTNNNIGYGASWGWSATPGQFLVATNGYTGPVYEYGQSNMTLMYVAHYYIDQIDYVAAPTYVSSVTQNFTSLCVLHTPLVISNITIVIPSPPAPPTRGRPSICVPFGLSLCPGVDSNRYAFKFPAMVKPSGTHHTFYARAWRFFRQWWGA